MKGLIASQTLIALETRMKQLQPDCAPVQSYFDYIAGTSIGAIMALALSHTKTSLETLSTWILSMPSMRQTGKASRH